MASANFAPPDPSEVGARWADIWEERLERSRPWGLSFLENRLDGDFWRARSLPYEDAATLDCALYVIGGWNDWYPTPLLRTFSRVRHSRKQALIGPWSHDFPDSSVPGARIDFTHEAVKFFGRHLRSDAEAEPEPAVTVFFREFTAPASFRL